MPARGQIFGGLSSLYLFFSFYCSVFIFVLMFVSIFILGYDFFFFFLIICPCILFFSSLPGHLFSYSPPLKNTMKNKC